MNIMSALLALIICAACTYRPPEHTDVAQPLIPESQILELIEMHGVPGMSFAALESCKVTASGVAGYANLEDQALVDQATVFEAASLSKPVFAWLVMSLVDEGLIELDETFESAGFEYERIADKGRYAQLTPRLVLSHRTGLPNWVGAPRDPGRSDIVNFESDPGTVHSYSGEAYLLLQAFVEERTQKSLQSIFENRLGPAMPNSSFKRPLPRGVRASRGYLEGQTEGDDVAPFERENAAYSLVTTSTDFARFMSLVCGQRMLTAKSYAEMTRVQTDDLPQDEPTKRWRLGWEALTIKEREAVFHTGDNGNYMAMALYFPDDGEGYVVMTNSETGLAFINEFLREAGAGERPG